MDQLNDIGLWEEPLDPSNFPEIVVGFFAEGVDLHLHRKVGVEQNTEISNQGKMWEPTTTRKINEIGCFLTLSLVDTIDR